MAETIMKWLRLTAGTIAIIVGLAIVSALLAAVFFTEIPATLFK